MTAPAPHVPDRPLLAVALICKDAARTIERTLEAVCGWADDVIALDSGSTDGTLEILERFGVRIERVVWQGFVRTRQASIDAARCDWVLCLDADESPDEAMKGSIDQFLKRAQAKERDGQPGPAGATINRKIWYRGVALHHAWQPERRLRLIHRARAHSGGLDPHAELVPNDAGAELGEVSGTLRHDGFVTFAEQLAKDLGYARTMAASLHARGVRGSRTRIITSPIGAFAKQMLIKHAWRDGWPGWCAAASTAAATLAKHICLVELSHARTREDR
jgi:hypothetical protein